MLDQLRVPILFQILFLAGEIGVHAGDEAVQLLADGILAPNSLDLVMEPVDQDEKYLVVVVDSADANQIIV